MSKLEDALKELERARKRGKITAEEYDARRAAIIYNPINLRPERLRASADQSRSGGGGWWKWGVLGCLTIFALGGALVVGTVVIVAVAIGKGASDHQDVHTAFAQGASGVVTTVGDVKNRVTIRAITDPATSTNQFEQPGKGQHYLAVAVTMENVGTHETGGGVFSLRMTDATEYSNTFVPGLGSTNLGLIQRLTSGGRTDTVVVFDVADGKKVQWLKFDPNVFAKGDLYFDASP